MSPSRDRLPARIAVTGASGNVGTALLRRLAREDVGVLAVARRVPAPGASPHAGATWLPLDLAAPDARDRLTQALAGVDALVHLAWLIQPSHDPALLARVNVDGTAAVVEAARAAGVAHLVHASSVGVYAPAADPRAKTPVSETWPATGIATSGYSRDKVATETYLDAVEATALPGGSTPVISRVRPGLVLQREAGGEIARYFAGPLLPTSLLRSPALGVLTMPLPVEFTVPVVHADDLAEAIVRVLATRLPGPVNVAAAQALTPDDIARGLGARGARPVPLAAVRALAAATWRARLQPTGEGWVDLAAQAPLLAIDRARTQLGWEPSVSAADALADVVAGMRDSAGAGTPPLGPRGPLRGRRVPTS